MRKYYAAEGVQISQDPDQYSTDFEKGLKKLKSEGPKPQDIIILGTLAGRVDHGLGMLHEMLREQTRDSSVRLWLFSETGISFLLNPGRNFIQTPLKSGLITPNVGIIPIFGPAKISTKGLEWDVSEWETAMGHQVSTSNHIVADEVEVETNHNVLFTIERASPGTV